ncbi:HD-GYP domain-containing protein [Paenibacillus filicis]|uniref:HD-GYP domain-containing protein n=1 Tax=Paenibacillus filicis TaxID=669464 RepID=A0ABU9DJW4_9BACL
MKHRSLTGPLAGILLPYGVYECFRRLPELDASFVMPRGHFYIVSAVSFLALIAAILVGIAGNRLRNIKVSFLALSFISMAEIFIVHGLATPGFIMHAEHLPGVAAQVSVLLTSLWLCLSTLSSDHPLIGFLSRYQRLLVPVWTTALAGLGLAGLMLPRLADLIPMENQGVKGLMGLLTIALNSYVIYRYYHAYRYSRFPLQIAIVYSSGWLIVSQYIMITGAQWRVSWWIYHFLLLASMLVMLVGLLSQYSTNRSLGRTVRALFTTDPMERITGSLSPSVRSLMAATEQKDTYTAGHNFRVTVYALRLAEELRLPPEELRALAQGTIVHDVGKIHVPDEILNKPGRLDPDERLVIERHPVSGYDMCRGLGFMKEELGIIRWHHERWDGTGYPDRLKGQQIPQMARIVAVADVYDALTSRRAYRQAMSHQEAMAFLLAQRGVHFDPVCVDAWEQLCSRDASIADYAMKLNERPSSASV